MSAPTDVARLLSNHNADLSFQRPFYEDLHERPELSGQEAETFAKIQDLLERFNCEVISPIGGFGLCAIFRNGDGPTVLFRADIDGLPVKEETGVPYASTRVRPRPDGTMTGVMHACGHDMHTAALAGICAIMDADRDFWNGTFIALFQPAEENATGANAMISDGLVTRIPRPDVCMGQHVMPGRAGEVQTMPGAIFAACDSIRITMYGRSAHGSMPHKAIDPTYIAAMVVVRLQGLVGREVDPDDFAVITVGQMKAGTTNNIIPDSAELVLNCRFFDNNTKRRIYSSIRRIVQAECEASQSPKPPEFEFFAHGELVDNSPEVYTTIRPTFDRVFGRNSVEATRWSASEDFSNIPTAFRAPYIFWTVGCTPHDVWDEAVANGTVDTDVPVNHQSTFLPDYEPTVEATTKAGAAAVLTYLSE
ncbi:amidohydrolase [Corynebacterium yudongzhengii]|uniref:Amidohydrolase n=1 Tax=Corynebacterium yudongzhengii TaxID=2080740 RepID=A0A2U1T6L4_9CORY|nr:amidohydrolase [Corynebacterium yudongzhengii]AWB81628.1 amidohydrolase [Corynebacterium yudongzhengii]PWC01613.1 amidohydrolase [Corynebacterium yudongzhengii]